MAYGIDDAAPLLPASVKAWLQGWLFRVLGFVVLLGCAATGASLLTWTAIDPILARATGSAANNLLGARRRRRRRPHADDRGWPASSPAPPLLWLLHLLTNERRGHSLKVALAPLPPGIGRGALPRCGAARSR